MLNRIAERITSPKTSLFFIGLMFFIPFCVGYHHYPIPAFYGEWLAAALGVLAMLGLLNKQVWQPLKLPQFSLVLIGLAAIVVMQAMLGMLHSPKYAMLVLSYLAWAFLLVLLGSHLRNALGWEKLTITLAWCLLIGAAYNVGFVALQIAIKSGVKIDWMPQLQSYGALAQANNFADYIGLSLASALYLYAKRQLQAKWFWPSLILLISLLAFSGSRSAWLYLAALTGLAIALQIKAIKQQTGSPNIRSLLRVGLVLLPLFAIIQIALNFALPDHLINLPNERLNEAMANPSASLRWQFWQTSWHLFTQSPWLGIGAGQMRWQTFMLLDTPALHPSKMVFEHAHNLFLHLLTEFGIGALILAVVGFAAWLRAFKWRELNLETWWIIAVLSIIGIHSLLEYPLWYTYFLGVFAFLIGAGDEKLTTLKLPKISQNILGIVTVAVMLLAQYNLTTMYLAYPLLERHQATALKLKLPEKDYNQYIDDLTWIYDKTLLSPYAELLLAASLVPNSAQVQSHLWLSESALKFSPTKKVAYKNVLLHKINGDQATAVKQLNRSLIAFPGSFVQQLDRLPMKYWQDYLDVLSIARPIPIKKATKTTQK